MMTPHQHVDLFRLQPSSSWKVETALSVSAMELVTAANSTSRKNSMPTARAQAHAVEHLGDA